MLPAGYERAAMHYSPLVPAISALRALHQPVALILISFHSASCWWPIAARSLCASCAPPGGWAFLQLLVGAVHMPSLHSCSMNQSTTPLQSTPMLI